MLCGYDEILLEISNGNSRLFCPFKSQRNDKNSGMKFQIHAGNDMNEISFIKFLAELNMIPLQILLKRWEPYEPITNVSIFIKLIIIIRSYICNFGITYAHEINKKVLPKWYKS